MSCRKNRDFISNDSIPLGLFKDYLRISTEPLFIFSNNKMEEKGVCKFVGVSKGGLNVQLITQFRIWTVKGRGGAVPLIPVDYYSSETLRKVLTQKSYNALNNRRPDLLKTSTSSPTNKSTNRSNTDIMSKLKKAAEKISDRNMAASKTALAIGVGANLNTGLMRRLKPKLPLAIRGYAEHPLGKVVIANAVALMVDTFMADNEQAETAADAMILSAMSEFTSSIDLEGLFRDLLTEVEVATDVNKPAAKKAK